VRGRKREGRGGRGGGWGGKKREEEGAEDHLTILYFAQHVQQKIMQLRQLL
jgi:hypothetical protein